MNTDKDTVKFEIRIQVEELADELVAQLTHNQLFELICKIELGVADWCFTEKILDYCKKEMEDA